MKKKFLKNSAMIMLTLALLATGFTSCSGNNNDDTTTVDKTELTALIDSCETLLDSATTDDYPQTAITTFQTTLTNVETAMEAATTQVVITNLTTQLRAAKETFLSQAYGYIDDDALVMGMSFDETISDNQFTTEGLGWTAILKKGPSDIFGTTTNYPSVKSGGVIKNCMYFSNGAHLEINDYSASSLSGSQLSISVWVKPDSTRSGNYIISYNYWETWKFQVQDNQKPYFTVQTNAGYVDADNEVDESVPNGEWTHLVVSLDLDAETLDLYVNGQLTKEWTSTDKENLTGNMHSYDTTLPLIVGVCTTYDEACTWSWSWSKTPAGWDSFVGYMDELKVYNIALTAGQVSKLYKEEKEGE